jgi:hypothetical protein
MNAARYAIAGQGLNRVVCKATTEEMLGPKKKHLDCEYYYHHLIIIVQQTTNHYYITTTTMTDLLQCTHEPNVSIPCLANLLIDRATASSHNWIIVFKSLITVHHLMCYGNERFTQYLATASSSAAVFPPSLANNFQDKMSSLSIEMSAFVRRYAKFLNSKAAAYRSLGCDPSKMQQKSSSPNNQNSSNSSSIRHMAADPILKTLPVLQVTIQFIHSFNSQLTPFVVQL